MCKAAAAALSNGEKKENSIFDINEKISALFSHFLYESVHFVQRNVILVSGCCLSPGSALLPDVSAWHLADGAGGLSGQSDSGSKAD